ncbi:MAG: hypothetical protein V1824_01150 [archaeon]
MLDHIVDHMTCVKLEDNITFISPKVFNHTNFYEFINEDSRFIVINWHNKPVGVMKFEGIKGSYLKIYYIQGVKIKDGSKPLKDWWKILLDNFIIAYKPFILTTTLRLAYPKEKEIYHKIYERYFTNEGYLNYNKKRVQRLTEIYSDKDFLFKSRGIKINVPKSIRFKPIHF